MNINKENKVILLAKAFDGDWCDKDNNVAHEIINFFKADDGKYYVYFSPYGTCNKIVYVNEGELEKYKRGNKKGEYKISGKYKAEYLLITSNAEINTDNDDKTWKSSVKIKYVIKLKKRLHFLSSTKDMNSNILQNPNYEEILKKITYGGKTLGDIFPYTNRIMPLVTFEADWIKEPVVPLEIKTCEYNFRRHKGYVYRDKYENDFKNLKDILTDFENNAVWKDFELQTINEAKENIKNSNVQKTFLDLIFKTNSETVYTNMLYNVLNYDDIFKKFLSYLRLNNIKAYNCNDKEIGLDEVSENKYEIYYEHPAIVDEENNNIDKGRMDICAVSNNCRVFIENKVESGLNHLKGSVSSQLSIYRDWAKNGNCNYLCLVLVPNYRKKEIENEILKYESRNKEYYKVITYSMIADFLEDQKNKNAFNGFESKRYIEDIINNFNKHAYNDDLELYTSRFIDILDRVKQNDE